MNYVPTPPPETPLPLPTPEPSSTIDTLVATGGTLDMNDWMQIRTIHNENCIEL